MMNSDDKFASKRAICWRAHSLHGLQNIAFVFLSSALSLAASSSSTGTGEGSAPASPRESFNAGTLQLRQGKLREAESLLESALASQNEALQPPALYNLGHVRFGQGVEDLKNSPPGGPTASRGRAAAQLGDGAIRAADEALAGDEVQKMVAAYMRGRGARKELKEAAKVVKRALEAHGAALGKWQRASGDFRSAVDLNQTDTD